VFEKLLGVPAHPLFVHAAVVFVPLLVAAALAYALVPRLRGRVGWIAVLLGVAAPFAAWFATLSGNRLRAILIAKNYPAEILDQVSKHQQFGDRTLWFALALAVVSVVQVLLTRGGARRYSVPSPGAWADWSLALLVVVLSIGTGYYVFKTGDTGAKAVWTGF
jgi:hypothetical protein